jgi:cytochrome c-type biogenesis protein CcmH/NrfG
MAAVFIGVAAPAFAQNGTLSGRVIDAERRTVDREGKPIVGAGRPKDANDPYIGINQGIVTLELKGDTPKKFQTNTDDIGGWYKSGLPPGTYDISVRREWRDPVPGRDSSLIVFTAEAKGIVLKPGEKVVVPEMAALTDAARAAGRSAPSVSNMSNSAADAANKRAAEMQSMLKDANAAAAAGKYEEAITMFTNFADKQAEKNEKCAACYVKIGEAQLHLAQIDKAEAAFLKAIELDPNLRDPYSQLASIYNGERKFDEAAKMSAKANELAGSAGAAGGGDAVSLYNAGIINWNAGKYEDARNEFAKAVKMDPKNANAQYYLGMTIFNLASSGKATMTDAKAPFQEYLKLAPTGEYVEVAKAILATIK